MKQVVQPISGGPVRVLDVPRPTVDATEVLVRTVASVVSAGTERAVSQLAQSSLLAKARARPDLVRQVVRKARTEGVGSTLQTVRARLAGDIPLGYSAAGIAVEVGEAVSGIRPGQLVATGGAGKANHAEWQAVPGLLCAPVPGGVPAGDAAFATIASVALHGLRLAEVQVGAKVVVVGLGLVGQLAARLALASGCDVAGIDVDPAKLERAGTAGVRALAERGEVTTAELLAWSRGRGADAVLVCAASTSSEVMARVPALCRDRARVVIVGDVGLDLDRTPFYERELSVLFARSYGPGRYERSYEDWAVDYPVGHVRWTEGRNLEAVLDLLAAGRLAVADLVTHRFPIEAAGSAYELIGAGREPYLAVALDYPSEERPDRPIVLRPAAARRSGEPRVGWIGAGAFSTSVLLPAFRAGGFEHFVSCASASGLSARRMAEQAGFERAVSGADAVIDDTEVDVVVIATPHDSHARLAAQALRAGKDVWCEKPIALSEEELDDVRAAVDESGRVLFIGYNRRFSPAVTAVREACAGRTEPMMVVYRVAAGPIPREHWYADRRQGGRLLGEVCHFVDTCQALVDRPIGQVRALAGGRPSDEGMSDDVAVLLGFDDGSIATIAYTSAAPSGLGKEHVEALAGATHLVIDDYRKATAGGTVSWHGRQDKGHTAAARNFKAVIHSRGNHPDGLSDMLENSRATVLSAPSCNAWLDGLIGVIEGLAT